MSEEGEQPVLFDLAPSAPPAAEAPYCRVCGFRGVVVRFGVTVCPECKDGRAQAEAAERVAEMNATRRRRHGKGSR